MNKKEDIIDAINEALTIQRVSDTLIAWEQFKKANWYESEAIDVEKMLMDSITHAKEDMAVRALVEASTEGEQLLAATENFLSRSE